MSENLSPVKNETAESGEDTENSKSKKKKKAIGAFVVEADPTDTNKSFWRRPKPAKETETSFFNPESSADTDNLSETEKKEAVKQLAAARKLELENPTTDSAESPQEIEAAVAYLANVEASGDIETTELSINVENQDAAHDEPGVYETVIETNTPSEGEIPLDTESIDDTPPPPDPGNGSGGRPPRNPNINEEEPGPHEEPPEPGVPRRSDVGSPIGQEESVPLNVALRNERRAQTDGLIVGAIVGYFVGRRRGRIKTEKKLLPVQKKLEKQVKTLQSELITREYQVRQAVREKLVAKPIESITKPIERSVVNGQNKLRPIRNRISTERIGHVLVAASSGTERATSVTEKQASTKENKPAKLELAAAKKKTESMDRTELLAISQNIIVEGTSLRQIYETHLISEKGLRRLVSEHLRGGNIVRTLKRELVERQIDFERDPLLRDKSYTKEAGNAGKAALASMLSGVGLAESSEQEIIKSKNKDQSSKLKAAPKTGAQTLVDTSLAALIGFLILIILTLLFRG